MIHVFEYEWDKQKIKIKHLIKSALGLYEKRIYARKCDFVTISSQEYTEFLEQNHLQGAINSFIRYGLKYNDELVSVIGFGKNRFNKNEIEMHRYCIKNGYIIIGCFQKLLKHCGINEFVSYIDLSHFDGSSYFRNGFKEISITPPNYKWVNDDIIYNFDIQKHKLSSLLENYDSNLTEDENMLNNRYVKVYDAGNLKVFYENSTNF